MSYSLFARLKYQLKRHAVGSMLILASLLALSVIGNIILMEDKTDSMSACVGH